jgi:1-acyl-sn-glycerol-3-phosphate acyltransferase
MIKVMTKGAKRALGKKYRLGRLQAIFYSLNAMEQIFRLMLESFAKYLRIDVHGIEHIPKRGKALIAPNHSGCSGLDAVMLTYLLQQKLPRIPRVLTLWTFFKAFPFFEPVAQRMGLKPASTENGVTLLKKNNLVVCFPEGEKGSFKPTSRRYRLQVFKTGFIRMALVTGAPIVPCVIIGAEETNINLATLKIHDKKKARDTLLPLPFNVIPLPAKWDIRFFAPIDISGYRKYADDKAKLKEIAQEIRDKMQAEVDHQLSKREYIYIKNSGKPRKEADVIPA